MAHLCAPTCLCLRLPNTSYPSQSPNIQPQRTWTLATRKHLPHQELRTIQSHYKSHEICAGPRFIFIRGLQPKPDKIWTPQARSWKKIWTNQGLGDFWLKISSGQGFRVQGRLVAHPNKFELRPVKISDWDTYGRQQQLLAWLCKW